MPYYIGDLKRGPNLENYLHPQDSPKTSKTKTDLEIFQKPFSKNNPKNNHKATRNGFDFLPFLFFGTVSWNMLMLWSMCFGMFLDCVEKQLISWLTGFAIYVCLELSQCFFSCLF